MRKNNKVLTFDTLDDRIMLSYSMPYNNLTELIHVVNPQMIQEIERESIRRDSLDNIYNASHVTNDQYLQWWANLSNV